MIEPTRQAAWHGKTPRTGDRLAGSRREALVGASPCFFAILDEDPLFPIRPNLATYGLRRINLSPLLLDLFRHRRFPVTKAKADSLCTTAPAPEVNSTLKPLSLRDAPNEDGEEARRPKTFRMR